MRHQVPELIWCGAWLAVMVLGGCIGKPTLKPAATDIQRAVHTHEPLTGAAPLFYVATTREGNLDTLYGITVGNHQATPILTLETSALKPGEIAPIGIDPAGFLVTAGVQNEANGTIQVVELKTGKPKKLIGPFITAEPWTITHYAPRQRLLGALPDAKGTQLTTRFTKAQPSPLTVNAETNRVLGIDSDALVLMTDQFPEGFALQTWTPGEAKPTTIFESPGPILSAIVERQLTGGLGGYALTDKLDGASGVQLWQLKESGGVALRDFAGRRAGDLVPPGWPPFVTSERMVLAIRAESGAAVDPLGAIYLVDADGVRRVQEADASSAWIIEPNHLCWIEENYLWYRPLDEPEANATRLMQLPAQRGYLVFPATWPGKAVPVE